MKKKCSKKNFNGTNGEMEFRNITKNNAGFSHRTSSTNKAQNNHYKILLIKRIGKTHD